VSDVPRLLAAFERGDLLRPDASIANTVDLARATYALCGVPGLELSHHARRMADLIGPHDHYVFVLIDGLGMNLLEHEPAAAFFHRYLAHEIRSVFPSSTAPALTSIATGAWPAEHGVPGWWTHLPEPGITATILPFTERFSKQDAGKHGVTPAMAFPQPSLAARITRESLRITHRHIAGSVYTRYSSGGDVGVGYRSLRDGVEAAIAGVLHAAGQTYTYLYVSFVDTAEHNKGVWSKAARRALRLVSSRLEYMAERLADRARIIITADHGQIDLAPGQQHVLLAEDPLLDLLQAPPHCEPRGPAFHLKPGMAAAFEHEFRDRWGEKFALLTVPEADDLRLFGPSPMAGETRRRLGGYVAVALEPCTLGLPPERPMVGFHGGLLPDEVRIPLILLA
jgi:hypothetical protein